MKKVIGAINVTIDGFCDHTAVTPDEEVHQHYSALLEDAAVVLYGRITFQLMQFWQNLIVNPSGEKDLDDFALAMDKIPKIVFSNTLKSCDWESASIAKNNLKEEILSLQQNEGNDIFVGSRSLIIQLLQLNLLDELQLCVHPVIAGTGMQLFENLNDRMMFKFTKSKSFKSGAIILYYEPIKESK